MMMLAAPSNASRVRSAVAARAASGSSFYAAMRVLPPAQRAAIFAIYGFCRAVDDVADGPAERAAKLAELARWRSHVEALYAGSAPACVQALAQSVRAFGLRREDFLSIIEGMEMDAAADIDAPDRATLDLYCDRVACAVGRLCVRVFGMREPAASRLAHHLGRALQLTNILRDVDEDAQKGRLYLPREILLASGIALTDPASVLAHPRLGDACNALASLASGHFSESIELMSTQPLRVVRSPMLMAKVYQHILGQLVARGWSAPRQRIRVAKSMLLWTLLRYGLI